MNADPKDKGKPEEGVKDPQPEKVDKATGMEAEWQSGKAAGKTEHLNIIIISWRNPGQVVLGRFIKAEDLAESKFDQKVKRYVIETDKGLISCVLGATADEKILPSLKRGDLLRIEYQGKQELDDGRSVNIFDIQRMERK